MLPYDLSPADIFGMRFMNSKYARRYRYKNKAAKTNNRTNNKKKQCSSRVF